MSSYEGYLDRSRLKNEFQDARQGAGAHGHSCTACAALSTPTLPAMASFIVTPILASKGFGVLSSVAGSSMRSAPGQFEVHGHRQQRAAGPAPARADTAAAGSQGQARNALRAHTRLQVPGWLHCTGSLLQDGPHSIGGPLREGARARPRHLRSFRFRVQDGQGLGTRVRVWRDIKE